MIFSDFRKNLYNTKHNHCSKFLRHYVHSSIIFPTNSFVKLIGKRRISDPYLYLDWNLSGGKYSLHKTINYWNNTFNHNDFTLVGKINMHMARMHWAKIKVKKMKRQNKTMTHKSKHRVFLIIVKRHIKYLNNLEKNFSTV